MSFPREALPSLGQYYHVETNSETVSGTEQIVFQDSPTLSSLAWPPSMLQLQKAIRDDGEKGVPGAPSSSCYALATDEVSAAAACLGSLTRTHWLTENAPPGRQDRWKQSALAFSLHTCELLGESPQHPEPQLPTGLGGGHNTCAVRRLLGGLSSPVHQGCLT